MITILKSKLLNSFNNVIHGFSTKMGLDKQVPFYFNLSFSIGDNPLSVKENRKAFFNELGVFEESVVFQKQIHSDIVRRVKKGDELLEGDSMITDEPGTGLAVSGADCLVINIFDKSNRVIAGVHSGWLGTYKRILDKTINQLKNEYNSRPENLYIWLSPAISVSNYEVKEDVYSLFDRKYLLQKSDKIYLDVKKINLDILSEHNIPNENIEDSGLCTYKEEYLHSYRRDKENSGRAYSIIFIK